MTLTIKPTQDQAARSIETQFPAVTVEIAEDELTVDQALELWKQAMAAWGYSVENLNCIKMVEQN